ncbi:hypothetical protein ACFS3C_10235 [Azotobacter vinelandii]|nr:hypothetical protein GCM10017624_05570 [Azotobacter vinelandii]
MQQTLPLVRGCLVEKANLPVMRVDQYQRLVIEGNFVSQLTPLARALFLINQTNLLNESSFGIIAQNLHDEESS